ncbi:uncharacterized protein [Spinacia oleracea]|uniref:F-box domain-containing protein n=1 Tax=Spinacia oleracea TaxID=3562 RepID=A0A9R0J7Q2_SPIOL|nr:uncharacterized protein LOC110801878 [Spinacia oleracea]
MEKETEESLPQIPDDVINKHILAKLPIKPLMCFKYVSRSWRSTISTLEFRKPHLESFTPPSPQCLLFSGNDGDHPLFTSATFDEDGGVSEIVKLGFKFDGGSIHVGMGLEKRHKNFPSRLLQISN